MKLDSLRKLDEFKGLRALAVLMVDQALRDFHKIVCERRLSEGLLFCFAPDSEERQRALALLAAGPRARRSAYDEQWRELEEALLEFFEDGFWWWVLGEDPASVREMLSDPERRQAFFSRYLRLPAPGLGPPAAGRT